MTPKVMPLPPWLATPDGLLIASRRAILEHDARLHGLEQPLGRRALVGRVLDPHRRDADLVAFLQPAVGLHATAVDADLAAADQLVDQAARGTLEQVQQEIVQPLPVAVFRDAHGAGGGGRRNSGAGGRESE